MAKTNRESTSNPSQQELDAGAPMGGEGGGGGAAVLDTITQAKSFQERTEQERKALGETLLREMKEFHQQADQRAAMLQQMGFPVPSGNGAVMTKGGKVDGRRGPRAGKQHRGRVAGVTPNSQIILNLVKKFAPNKKTAKTKAELTELKSKDADFKGVTDIQLNAGLQANRPPKVKNAKIGLVKGPGGNARGGKYFAL